MSWQRIDENTYIDETLVTCAEYQLFIDEMREQGKYYQPDHWSSYRFPDGQAREPILGVRYSDAVTFCDWLTQRDTGAWFYRLPIHEETKKFPIKDVGKGPLGFWVNAEFQFAWISSVPDAAREIDFRNARMTELALDIALGQIRDQIISRAIDVDLILDFAYKLDRALESLLDRINHPLRGLGRIRRHAIDGLFNLAPKLNLALNREHAASNSKEQVLGIDYAVNLALELALDLHSDISGQLTRRSYQERHPPIVSFERPLDPDFIDALALNRDLALEIYLDLFTIQERIAGRSPAFEGIRLVKERAK